MNDLNLWEKIDVRWDFNDRLCGSVPMDPELVKPWLESRMAEVDPEVEAEVVETIDEAQTKVTLGFQKDESGLFVRGGTVKAHIKDCANQIKESVKIKNFRSKVANKVYVAEGRIYLYKDGDIAQKVDGTYDQPIHVITPRGPRNSLKTISYLQEAHINFTIKLLGEDKEVTREHLEAIFEYGSVHGYGGERGMGEGRYTAIIL